MAEGAAQYSGTFVAGKKHGKGTKVWPNGDRYEGDFVDDRKEGMGTYSWGANGQAAGEVYSGEFKADKRHGTGTYTWTSGEQYIGAWFEDAMAGPLDTQMLARARAAAEVQIGRAHV